MMLGIIMILDEYLMSHRGNDNRFLFIFSIDLKRDQWMRLLSIYLTWIAIWVILFFCWISLNLSSVVLFTRFNSSSIIFWRNYSFEKNMEYYLFFFNFHFFVLNGTIGEEYLLPISPTAIVEGGTAKRFIPYWSVESIYRNILESFMKLNTCTVAIRRKI